MSLVRLTAIQSLTLAFAEVARAKVRAAAERAAWPLPDALALHLWMYAEGLAGPTPTEDGETDA